jgi:hypothetical protein
MKVKSNNVSNDQNHASEERPPRDGIKSSDHQLIEEGRKDTMMVIMFFPSLQTNLSRSLFFGVTNLILERWETTKLTSKQEEGSSDGKKQSERK